MKRIYSQNVQIGESGAIGATENYPGSRIPLMPSFMAQRTSKNVRMSSAQNRRTHDYLTRYKGQPSGVETGCNWITEDHMQKPISRSSLNQFQNRNKALLQYKSQFDKMREMHQEKKQKQMLEGPHGGFKGFGQPKQEAQNKLGPLANAKFNIDGTTTAGKKNQAKPPSASSKTQEIADRMKGKTVAEIILSKNKQMEEQKKASLQSNKTKADKEKEANSRRQKTTFLKELINLRSEVAKQPNFNNIAIAFNQSKFDSTIGQALNLQLQPNNQNPGLQVQERVLVDQQKDLFSSGSTPTGASGLEIGQNERIYSVNIEHKSQSKTTENRLVISSAANNRQVVDQGNELVSIDKQYDQENGDTIQNINEEQHLQKQYLALPDPNQISEQQIANKSISETLINQIGDTLALQVVQQQERIQQEIKQLRGNIQKEIVHRKRKKKSKSKDRPAESTNMLTEGYRAESRQHDYNTAVGASQEEADQQNINNAFMTQYPQQNPDNMDVRYNELLQVDLQNMKIKKSKTWRENEQKVKKCLNFLGIKDKYMLDHFYPGFQLALENKARQNHVKDLERIDIGPVEREGDGIPYEWITMIQSTADGELKRKPMNMTDALRGDQESYQVALRNDKQSQEPKRLKICKFNDQELQMMCYKQFRQEKQEWKLIQSKKDQKSLNYIEPVVIAKPSTQVQERKKQTIFNKAKRHRLHDKIMDALQAARRESGLVDDVVMIEDLEELFDPEQFVGDQFKALSLEELQNYLYQALQIQLNETEDAIQSEVNEPELGNGVEQQQSTSYKERVAFIKTLKKKWMVQKGYCSMFDRLREQRLNGLKVATRKKELDLRKYQRRKFVSQSLKRAMSGHLLHHKQPRQYNHVLQSVARTRSHNSQQFDTLDNKNHKSQSNLFQQTLFINKNSSQNIYYDQNSMTQSRKNRSKGALFDISNADHYQGSNITQKKFYHADISQIPRPLTHSPSQSQRDGGMRQFNRDITEIHQTNAPSQKDGGTQSPKSLREWTEEKVTGNSLTNINSFAQPHGLSQIGRQSDPNQVKQLQKRSRQKINQLFDVAKKDMDSLDKLMGEKQNLDHIFQDVPEPEQQKTQIQENILSLNEIECNNQKIQINQVVKPLVMPYSDHPRFLDKPSEPRLRTTGMSSLILSPQAKVDLIESSKGEIFKKAKELESEINKAEKEIFEAKKINVASSINSPGEPIIKQENVVVRITENDQQTQDMSDCKRQQASIEAKLALFQTQANYQQSSQKTTSQFQEPLVVRQVSPDLLKKPQGFKFDLNARNQNLIPAKEYRSAHAKRQRDIKKLNDSKQNRAATAKPGLIERTAGNAQFRTQKEENDNQYGFNQQVLKDQLIDYDAKTKSKQSSFISHPKDNHKLNVSSAAAFQDLRPALNRLAIQPIPNSILKLSEQNTSEPCLDLHKNNQLGSATRTYEDNESKELIIQEQVNMGNTALQKSLRDSKGSLILQGKSMLDFEQLKQYTRQKPLAVLATQQFAQIRHRSRDMGSSQYGINVDIMDSFGKQKAKVNNDHRQNERMLSDIQNSKVTTGSQPTIKTQLIEELPMTGIYKGQMNAYDQRPDGSSFETKRRSDLHTSNPEIQEMLHRNQTDKQTQQAASSQVTLTGQNVRQAKSNASTPGHQRDSITHPQEIYANRMTQGRSQLNSGQILLKNNNGTKLEHHIKPESTLTQYVGPNKLKKNQPIFSQYLYQNQAAALTTSKQITSLDSGFQDQDFLQNRLDLANFQQFSEETPINKDSGGEAGTAIFNLQDKGSSLVHQLSNQTPNAQSTFTQKSIQPQPIAAQSAFVNQNQIVKKQPKKSSRKPEDATKANTNALETTNRGLKSRAQIPVRKEVLKPTVLQLDKNISNQPKPVMAMQASQPQQHISQNKQSIQSHTLGANKSSIANKTDEGNDSESFAIYVMPHMHLTAHARLRQYPGFQPGDQEFTKMIKNETYFSRMARINPSSFAISGQGIKGNYITPKQLAQMQKQSKNKQKRNDNFQNLVHQVDQNTGPDYLREAGAQIQIDYTLNNGQNLTHISDDSKLQQTGPPINDVLTNRNITEQTATAKGGGAFVFPSIHINQDQNDQVSPENTETAGAIGANHGQSQGTVINKATENRGPGSIVTADMHFQNLSPTEMGNQHQSRKVERERYSFDPLQASKPQRQSPRFSMQDPQLTKQQTFKGTIQGNVESFSEVSPGFRLPNQFEHDIMRSGQQTTENFKQIISAKRQSELDDLQGSKETVNMARPASNNFDQT